MHHFLEILAAQNLTPEDIQTIQSVSSPLNVKSYKTLIDYNEQCSTICFVLKGGFVMKVLNEENGEERCVSFNLPTFQPFLTSPKSFFSQVPSNCRLQAFKNSDVLVFERDALLELTETIPRFKDFYHQQIINVLLLELDFRMRLITHSPQRLYMHLLSDYPEIIQNVPAKDIANFIGISPEWLSNLKKKI